MTQEIHESFGVSDRLGRAIGARVEVLAPGVLRYAGDSEGGTWRVRPWATRNGKPYGAIQSWRQYSTESEALSAAAIYFAGARARAAKQAAKHAATELSDGYSSQSAATRSEG